MGTYPCMHISILISDRQDILRFAVHRFSRLRNRICAEISNVSVNVKIIVPIAFISGVTPRLMEENT